MDDKIGEKVKSDAHTFKEKIDDKKTVLASVWTGGSLEGILIHVISTMNYIDCSKLFKGTISAKKATGRHSVDLKEVQGYLGNLNKKLQKAQAKVAGYSKKKTEGTTLGGPIPAGTAQAATTTAKKKGTTTSPIPATKTEVKKVEDETKGFKKHLQLPNSN